MKKLIYILIFLIATIRSNAQVLDAMENGVPEAVLLSASNDGNFTAIVKSQDGYLLPYHWDGQDWTKGVEGFGIGKIGLGDGEFKLVSAVYFENVLYVATLLNEPSDPKDKPVVFRLKNDVWSKVADNNQILSKSDDIYKLLVLDENLIALIKTTVATPSSIAYLNGSEWDIKVNSITVDPANNYFSDATNFNGKIYATGGFSYDTINKSHLAEWDGTKWSFPVSQPFISAGGKVFGYFKGDLVLFGTPDIGNEAIKVFDNSSWKSLSNGLSNIEISDLNSFAESNGMLWACGSFRNKTDSKTSSLIYLDKDLVWKVADEGIDLSSFLSTNGDKAILSGSFNSLFGQELNNVAILNSGYAAISGSVFADLNSNCIMDAGDKPAAWTNIVLNPGGHYFLTDENGFYKIPVHKGNYTITVIPDKHWEIVCTQGTNFNVSDLMSFRGLDIAIRPKPGKKDIAVSVADYDGWKASLTQPVMYKFCAKNVGTESIISGKLIVHIPNELMGMKFNPVPTSWVGNDVKWDLSNLLVGQNFCVVASGLVQDNIESGQKIRISAKAEIFGATDEDIGDNAEELEEITVEKYNSNAKSSDRNGAVNKDSDPLHYRINFQNTGNGIVNKIRVIDTLDKEIWINIRKAGIEYSSIHNGAQISYDASERYQLEPDGNYIRIHKWTFNNINLPDSASDFEASKGYVDLTFYCDLKWMKKESQVCNTGYIYFDNSEPIVTNRVCNAVNTISIRETESGNLRVFPNPANELLHVFNESTAIENYELINILGTKIIEGYLHSGSNKLSTKALPNGIYFLRVENHKAIRLVVAH